jgi:hypothetical protein
VYQTTPWEGNRKILQAEVWKGQENESGLAEVYLCSRGPFSYPLGQEIEHLFSMEIMRQNQPCDQEEQSEVNGCVGQEKAPEKRNSSHFSGLKVLSSFELERAGWRGPLLEEKSQKPICACLKSGIQFNMKGMAEQITCVASSYSALFGAYGGVARITH